MDGQRLHESLGLGPTIFRPRDCGKDTRMSNINEKKIRKLIKKLKSDNKSE